MVGVTAGDGQAIQAPLRTRRSGEVSLHNLREEKEEEEKEKSSSEFEIGDLKRRVQVFVLVTLAC